MKQTMNLCILNVYNRYELRIKDYKSCTFEVRDIFFCFNRNSRKKYDFINLNS